MPLIVGYYITKVVECSYCKGTGTVPRFGPCECLRSNYPRREAMIYPLEKALIEIKSNQPVEQTGTTDEPKTNL